MSLLLGRFLRLSLGLLIILPGGEPRGALTVSLPAPIPLSPTGVISNTQPQFSWQPVDGASEYQLVVNNNNKEVLFQKWISRGDICSNDSCSLKLGFPLIYDGNYSWKVQARTGMETSRWSVTSTFTLILPLEMPDPIAPLGKITSKPEFEWEVNASVSEVAFILATGTTKILDGNSWQNASGLCNKKSCKTSLDLDLKPGVYYWRVAVRNAVSTSPWSTSLVFELLPPAPDAPLPLSPTGIIYSGDPARPTFVWSPVTDAESYLLFLKGPLGNIVNKWYSTEICSTSRCMLTPHTALPRGYYTWYLQARNKGGQSPSSPLQQFQVILPPEKVSLRMPFQVVSIDQPTYMWDVIADAVEYNLVLEGMNGVLVDTIYKADKVCIFDLCSVSQLYDLTEGKYFWKVQGINPAGRGPWSVKRDFDAVLTPLATQLVSPSGTFSDQVPPFKWKKDKSATYYILDIEGPEGPVFHHWYRASGRLCPEDFCSIDPQVSYRHGNQYTWTVQIRDEMSPGEKSNPLSFIYLISLPQAATALIPDGNTATNPPEFLWSHTGASEYTLFLEGPTGQVVQQTFPSSRCDGFGCRVKLPGLLSGGLYTWKVQSKNAAGNAPWSNQVSFTLPGFTSSFNGSAREWEVFLGNWTFAETGGYNAVGLSNPYPMIATHERYFSFELVVDFVRQGCEKCGNQIVIRAKQDAQKDTQPWERGYVFDLSNSGHFSIWKWNNNQLSALQYWTDSPVIKTDGTKNSLRVIAYGAIIYLYINGSLVWQGVDYEIVGGQVGIGMVSSNNSGDQLTLTQAALTVLEEFPKITDQVSVDQLALNVSANLEGKDSNQTPDQSP